MTRIKILLLLICTQLLWAQPSIEGKMAGIDQSGWHEILITPEVRAASKPDLADFRIHDRNKKDVPYFLTGAAFPKNNDLFREFRIISQEAIPGRSTVLVVENPKPQLTELSIIIGNSAVTKRYRISGSNDNVKWFGVIDNDSLQNIENSVSAFTTKMIALPKTSYKFLKIAFDDTKTLPLNITRVGNFPTVAKPKDVFISIGQANIKTRRAGQNTVTSIVFDGQYSVDRIQFEISNPKMYRRNVRIYVIERVKRKRRTVSQQHVLAAFGLSSDGKKHIDLPKNNVDTLFIEIENGDNQPLEIANIHLLQRPIYAVAALQQGEPYTISSGATSRSAPDYDIEHFSTQILTELHSAKIVNVKKEKSIENAVDKQFWQRSCFLWACILIAGLAILYFSISLIREINGKQSDQ